MTIRRKVIALQRATRMCARTDSFRSGRAFAAQAQRRPSDLFRKKRTCPMPKPRTGQRSRTHNCPDSPKCALAGNNGLVCQRQPPVRQWPGPKRLTERPGEDVAWRDPLRAFKVERSLRYDNILVCKKLNPTSVNSAWRTRDAGERRLQSWTAIAGGPRNIHNSSAFRSVPAKAARTATWSRHRPPGFKKRRCI
jgi:hypothetical protein